MEKDTMEARVDEHFAFWEIDDAKKFIRQEISLALQKREEELREKIEELRRRFKCAKCDGAKTLEHTQCCQALNII